MYTLYYKGVYVFGLFKHNKEINVTEVNFKLLINDNTEIKTVFKSITAFRDSLSDIERQIISKERRLTVTDVNITSIKTIPMVDWLVDENGYVHTDLNHVVKDIITYIKVIISYNADITSRLSCVNNSYNVRRLSPHILHAKNFLRMLNIHETELT